MTIASVALAAFALLILLAYPLALATGRAPLIAASGCLVIAALLWRSSAGRKPARNPAAPPVSN